MTRDVGETPAQTRAGGDTKEHPQEDLQALDSKLCEELNLSIADLELSDIELDTQTQ